MPDILAYYLRRDVQGAILRECSRREIGVKYGDKGFGKRPQVLSFEGDIGHLAKGGATSFQISEERWSDPLRLTTGVSRKQLDELRSGWDLVLDIDTNYFGFAKICAGLLIEALEYYDVYSYGIKFSGRSGFHIGIPFEAFPKTVNSQPVKQLFPEGVRTVAGYLKHVISKRLSSDILSVNTLKDLAQGEKKKDQELMTNGKFDPFKIVNIDSVAISSRHMIRAPYSINEKSGLVSIPIKKEELQSFNPSKAKAEEVSTKLMFLDPSRVSGPQEAKHLLIEAFDWGSKNIVTPMEDEEKNTEKTYEDYQEAVSEKLFPPCIVSLLNGVPHDGRKRSIFVLIQFLRNMSWSFEKIQDTLLEWNKKNYEELPEGYIMSQINWHKRQNEKVPPPNCKNESYYLGLNVCNPNQWCRNIKNPLQHVGKRVRAEKQMKRKPVKKRS